MLEAMSIAGVRPIGIDHSAFGMIRALAREVGSPVGPGQFVSAPSYEERVAAHADGVPAVTTTGHVPAKLFCNLGDVTLQLRHSGLPGCIFSPSLIDGTPSQKVHRWLSPPIPDNFQLLLDGEATLSLWTRTLNAAVHPGRICVFLYARKLNVLGQPVDVLMVNQDITNATWFPHEADPWPRSNWTEVSVPMNFIYAAGSLLPGERLGVAISVEKGGTNPGDGLEFLYDHPSFDSRLQVKTSSVLPIFGN